MDTASLSRLQTASSHPANPLPTNPPSASPSSLSTTAPLPPHYRVDQNDVATEDQLLVTAISKSGVLSTTTNLKERLSLTKVVPPKEEMEIMHIESATSGMLAVEESPVDSRTGEPQAIVSAHFWSAYQAQKQELKTVGEKLEAVEKELEERKTGEAALLAAMDETELVNAALKGLAHSALATAYETALEHREISKKQLRTSVRSTFAVFKPPAAFRLLLTDGADLPVDSPPTPAPLEEALSTGNSLLKKTARSRRIRNTSLHQPSRPTRAAVRETLIEEAYPEGLAALAAAALDDVDVADDDDEEEDISQLAAQLYPSILGRFVHSFDCIFIVLEIVILYPRFHYSCRRGLDNILVLLIGRPPFPTFLSVILAVGAQQLAKYKAIVTRITAIEKLPGVTILCSDKTGTLMINKLTTDKSTLKTYSKFSPPEEVILYAYCTSRTKNTLYPSLLYLSSSLSVVLP
ncbi:hypothetical protein JCM8097_005374 [Rhodosporidiobolus ruineniae]